MLTDEGGQFPSLKSILNSDEFINADDEYFGDQKINQVLVEAANQDITQFQYLPYTQYATTIYPDYTGPAYMVRSGWRTRSRITARLWPSTASSRVTRLR